MTQSSAHATESCSAVYAFINGVRTPSFLKDIRNGLPEQARKPILNRRYEQAHEACRVATRYKSGDVIYGRLINIFFRNADYYACREATREALRSFSCALRTYFQHEASPEADQALYGAWQKLEPHIARDAAPPANEGH